MRAHPWIGLAAALALSSAAHAAAHAVGSADQDPIVANDPEFMATFGQQYKRAFGEGGAIPAKYKQLSGATLSVALKCEDCLRYHVQMAINLGATRQEIVEALRIGLLAGGSAGMPTMGAAYPLMEAAKLK